MTGIDLSVPGAPSLVMRDLSEYVTLPFMAAFDVQPHPRMQTPQKRITYIGIAKKAMPMLVDLFIQFKSSVDIYLDGTLEAILAVSATNDFFALSYSLIFQRRILFP